MLQKDLAILQHGKPHSFSAVSADYSFVPRPTVRFCQNRGKGRVYFIGWMTPVYTSRQWWGGVPNWKNGLEAFSCDFCSRCWSFWIFAKWKMHWSWFKTMNACAKYILSIGDPSPLQLSTLVDTDVIHVIKWIRPSPSVLHTASNQKLDCMNCKNKLVVLTTQWLPWLQTN